MEITTVGPWVLLGIGGVTLLASVWVSIRPAIPKGVWMMWVFGFAISGTGIYGPVFLGPYGKFLAALQQMAESPGTASYASAFNQIARGKLPPKYQRVVLAYALEHPIQGMDAALSRARDHAPDSAGKKALGQAITSLEGKKRVADQLTKLLQKEGQLKPAAIKNFDPATAALIAQPLLQKSDHELHVLGLNKNVLQPLAAPRPSEEGR